MRKPRTNILLPTTILAVVGLVGLAWLARGVVAAPPESSALVETQTARAASAPVVLAPSADDFVEADTIVPTSLSVPSRSVTLPRTLSDDDSVLVAKMCDLHLLADGTDLALDSKQWAAFAAVVLQFQAIRHHYESSIARLKVVAPGRYQVEVPAYAEAGDELREQFFAELRAALGEPKGREVMAQLGSRLEGCFAGFGVSEQTLEITANRTGQSGEILVTRTARFWNSAEAGERLTTLRETHLPALEDPSGDNWGALLAMVKTGNAVGGPG